MVDTLTRLETRNRLRTELRALRATLTPQQVASAALRFTDHCLPLLAEARHIAGYFAIGGELPVAAVLQQCRARGATSYAPIVCGQSLRFLPFDEDTPMRRAHFDIQVPDVPNTLACDPPTMDAVLVPLVGFDADCNRLGMGGGFYDRTFAAHRERDSLEGSAEPSRHSDLPLLIGCAHSSQQVATVWPDWWDVPLDMVVTDTGVIHRPS